MSIVPNIYEFGDFTIDVEVLALYHKNERTTLEPQNVEYLLLMARKAGEVVTNEQALEEIWNDISVSDQSILTSISLIRKALNDTDKTIIKNVRGRGYRLTLPVNPKIINKSIVNEIIKGQPSTSIFQSVESKEVEISEQNEKSPAPSEFLKTSDLSFLIALFLVGFSLFLFFYLNPFCQFNCVEKNLFTLAICVGLPFLNCTILILEVAYQFDKYQWIVLPKIPQIFLISLIAAICSLNLVEIFIENYLILGVIFGGLVIVFGQLLNNFIASKVLPNHPITEAHIRTQPALGAFKKNLIFYILPIYFFFGICLYGVMFQENLKYQTFIMPLGFFLLLLIFALVSLVGTMELMNNLKSEKNGEKLIYYNFFWNLLILRALLLFGPAVALLAWYFFSLFH